MTGRSLTNAIGKLKLRLQGLSAMGAAQRSALIRTRVLGAISDQWAGLKRKIGLYLVRGIEKTVGSGPAHQVFWRLWPSAKGWSNVESRLFLLARENPDKIAGFVRLALHRTNDPVVLIGLARNPFSRAPLAALLTPSALRAQSAIAARADSSIQYAAALVSAAALLVDEPQAREIAIWLTDRQAAPSERYYQVIDSMGLRPASPPADPDLRGLLQSGFRRPVRHRLVIVEDYTDQRAVAQLFVGADKVTLIGLNDTFGKADLSEFAGAPGIGQIVVEHVRSRITRFSPEYVSNHEGSRDVAVAIAARLAEVPGLMGEGDRPFVEVAIADFLHFQCLRIEALRQLLADPEFDHIVIGTIGQPPGATFFRLLGGIEAVKTDPRVEMVSISRAMSPRVNYIACLASVLARPAPATSVLPWAPPLSRVLADLDLRSADLAATLEAPAAKDRPRVLVVTANNPAYNPSTARYAAALDGPCAVGIAHAGLKADEVHEELGKQGKSGAQIGITILRTQFPGTVGLLHRWISSLITDVLAGLPESSVTHALRISVDRLATEVVHGQLVYARVLEAWFARLQAEGNLPDLVILSPNRAPQVGAFAPVARRYNVPTLTLEAHGLNANYSRYTKVSTDYYGVVSDHFRQQAETGFGIPKSRTVVIGTPRIIAPKGHDPAVAQLQARRQISGDQGFAFDRYRGTLSFFCQPSGWSHVALVWRNVLAAAVALDLGILLKPHPEETPTRVAGYLAMAREMGAGDRVKVVSGGPTVAIEAADVVLTGYSAAALDAAVLGVPVICVTEGDQNYPVDQHEMIGAPLVRSAAELQAALAACLADPDATRHQAAEFLQREAQFVEGPDGRLRALVAEIVARPKDESLRPVESVPQSVFLDGPHPIFPV